MSMRRATSLVGLCLATAAAGLLSPAAAQQWVMPQWVMPRTPDGHPDLQGNWTNATLTPFERTAGRGPVYTADEVATLEAREAALVLRGAQPSDPNRAPPTVASGIGGGSNVGYNYVYIDRGDRVAIVNDEPRASLITNPSDGRRPALTSEAQQRVAERREFRSQFGTYDNPEHRPLGERCIVSFGSSTGPPMIPNRWYNNNYTIVQTADYVMIHTEMVHDTRIIRLGEPEPLPDQVRPWMGDSWGRWEGNTLVVETTNLNHSQAFRGIAPTDALKVIERFTRVDEETILYEFTMDDPTTYTQPWGGEVPFTKFDQLLYEYACHEGNYSLSNILSGARYQERQAAGN